MIKPRPVQSACTLSPAAGGGGAAAQAERRATGNPAAFLHWLEAVHGWRLAPTDDPRRAIRRWAESEPAAATLIRAFAGPLFTSARLAAGLLLDADLRPDDRILIGQRDPPTWLPLALAVTGGAGPGAEPTVLLAAILPEVLPPTILRVVLTGSERRAAPPGLTVSYAADWTYPSESSAD